MRLVFILGDGRTLEVPMTGQVHLTCHPQHLAISVLPPNGQKVEIGSYGYPYSIHAVSESCGDSIEWCEELWKLEDSREKKA
jgi:hypothetical protein